MALQILENKGNFYIQGKITCDNVLAMKLHIEYVLEKRKYITIDITKVTEIDIDGVAALTEIYQKTLLTNKIFTIIGIGCKEIYDHFNSQGAA
jgi:ABC-type transporter Mla MlaB component